jgi:hypothetical protein
MESSRGRSDSDGLDAIAEKGRKPLLELARLGACR